MKTQLFLGVPLGAAVFLLTSFAAAQEAPTDSAKDASRYPRAFAPVVHALELHVGTGYAQGLGKFADGSPSSSNTGSAGGAVELGVGYRLIPNLTLGVYGSGSTFARGDGVDSGASLYSATAGAQATVHILPDRNLDPWIGIGTGWRGYWSSGTVGTSSSHGLQLVRLQLGTDFRVSETVAISPVVGADLSVFLTEEAAGQNAWKSVRDANVNTFVFAGLLGRFDLATGSVARSSSVASLSSR